jgi:hypothetical protein
MSKQQPIDFSPLTDVNSVNAMIKLLKGDKFHVLPASIPDRVARIPDQHQICFSPKLFEPDPKGPDMYHDKRTAAGQVCLKGSALGSLWNAAGGCPAELRTGAIASTRIDDGSDPNYVEWQYVGKYREIGGIWISEVGSKRIDLRDGSAQIKGMTPEQLSQERGTMFEKAESKAMNRMIRKALGIKPSYSEEEASWPFVVIRPMLVVNLSDPMQRAMYLADAMGSSAALFGNAEFMQRLMLPGGLSDDEAPQPLPQGNPQRALNAQPETKTAATAVNRDDARRNFEAADETQQLKIIAAFVLQKGYGAPPAMYNPQSAKHRLSFYNKLVEMPDAEADLKF